MTTSKASAGAWTVLIFVLSLFVVAFCSLQAHAHIHDRPELNVWASQLVGEKGLCCNGEDVFPVEQWDTVKGEDGWVRYRVFIEDKWMVVPDNAVLKNVPNLHGQPLVWLYKHMNGPAEIRCFLPGAGM